MKKLFFLISLMSVVLVSCTNQKQEAPLAEEVEEQVTDVTFTNPQVSIADNMVTYSVTISYSKGKEKGKEVLMKNLPILLGRGSGNVCLCRDNPLPLPTQLGVPVVCMGDMSAHHERNWSHSAQEYTCKVDTWLSDKIISNMITVIMPENVSVEKYGKVFTFEDVNFNVSAGGHSLTKQDDKLTIQEISVHLYFGDYQSDVLLRNEIHTL